jgi:hypoxanthine-guanine phosphoribosyltransferase
LRFVVLGAESSATRLRTRSEFERVIRGPGKQVSKGHPEGIVQMGPPKGSLHLFADLSRALRVHCLIDLIALGAY